MLFAGILVALLLAIGEFCIESRRRQSLRLGLCLPGRLINLYFMWKDGRKERQQRICAGQRLKGSQLYLDNFGPVDGTPDWSEGQQLKTETGTGRTRLSEWVNFYLLQHIVHISIVPHSVLILPTQIHPALKIALPIPTNPLMKWPIQLLHCVP